MAWQVAFTRVSSNKKTGPIPVTTSERSTCPPECPLLKDAKTGEQNGCFAEAGYYTRTHWDKVTAKERGTDWQGFLDNVRKLPIGTMWRHNIAGDLPNVAGVIAGKALADIVTANKRKNGFTYTHCDPLKADNKKHIAEANRNGFTVNLSADSPEQADEYLALELPVVTLLPEDAPKVSHTPNGARVVRCPATVREDVSCATCGLCARADRSYAIGFPVHGSQKSKIKTV